MSVDPFVPEPSEAVARKACSCIDRCRRWSHRCTRKVAVTVETFVSHSPAASNSGSPAGERLALLRSHSQVSVAELALSTGIDRPVLERIERGQAGPTARQVTMLAEALGIDPRAFEPETLLVMSNDGVVVVARSAARPPSTIGGWLANRATMPDSLGPRPALSERMFEALVADYEQHFDLSKHVWADVGPTLTRGAIAELTSEFELLIDAEVEALPYEPSGADLAQIGECDTLRDAWLRLGKPVSGRAFAAWAERCSGGAGQNPEPVIVALLARDATARTAAAAGVRGLAYSCMRCREWSTNEACRDALLRIAGQCPAQHGGAWL